MCWIAVPLTPSKYSVKCVLSLDLQSRFRNEFTSVLLGNVIEHIQKCIRISIAMGRRNHLPRKCMAPVTTAHILPSSIQRTCVHLSTVSRGTATSRIQTSFVMVVYSVCLPKQNLMAFCFRKHLYVSNPSLLLKFINLVVLVLQRK